MIYVIAHFFSSKLRHPEHFLLGMRPSDKFEFKTHTIKCYCWFTRVLAENDHTNFIFSNHFTLLTKICYEKLRGRTTHISQYLDFFPIVMIFKTFGYFNSSNRIFAKPEKLLKIIQPIIWIFVSKKI
jgi:hypothetical protein